MSNQIIDFFMIAFTFRKQGLHNFISRTLLLKVKKKFLSPLFYLVKNPIDSTIKWYIQPLYSDRFENELRGNS